jgi:hypothetical protein
MSWATNTALPLTIKEHCKSYYVLKTALKEIGRSTGISHIMWQDTININKCTI